MTAQAAPLDRGVFTLSLDFELIWGTLDLFGPARFERACLAERVLLPRLLDLFARYEVSATWCVLGHLFLASCAAERGLKHPGIARPRHSWCRHEWFHHDPCATEATAPLFYGRTLLELIRACAVPQEIGCHSFSHVIFGDPGCSTATAEGEVRECVRLARDAGIELRSFAFPRNSVGHLDTLRAHGFRYYRGPEPGPGPARGWASPLRRLAHLWQVLRAAEPPVSVPEQTAEGLWNIPGSMIYFPMHGLRRFIPVSVRVRRAVRGLEAAVRQRRVFHLWFHPTNMADQEDRMFAGLEAILSHARTLARRGDLSILPMNQVVSPLTSAGVGSGPRDGPSQPPGGPSHG